MQMTILWCAVSLNFVFMCCFRPYTPMKGAQSHVWFDRHKISQDCPEHLESIDYMCSNLSAVVQDEIRAGIPKDRLIIGTVGISLYPLFSSLSSHSTAIYLSLSYCFLLPYILSHSTCSKLSRVSDHCS